MGTIRVTSLGKAYKQYFSRWSRLREWLSPGKRCFHDLKWVLRDISFSIEPGEAVGIIGINGAGKSTLLKMITGTSQPSEGSVHLSGRVAALLELGMGFHPDFTGRQNVYMAGQLLGLNTAEIDALMPEIEAFAEIGDYIDKPARVYSSGMQMRLAFSVATAVRPDILIVDEALSVGDAYFQHKSFERIREFRSQGTTLLIVSHDKQAIQGICDRAILLNDGHVAMEGEPEAVMDFYNALLADHQPQAVRQETLADGKIQTISGSGEVMIKSVALLSAAETAVEVINVGQAVRLQVVLLAQAAVKDLVVGYVIKDRLGQAVFGTNTHHLKHDMPPLLPGKLLTCNFDFLGNFGEGHYSVSIALHTADTHLINNYEWRDRALMFNVVNMDKPFFVGTAWAPPLLEYKE